MAYARPMRVFNLFGDEWNETTDHEGFAFKDAWVGDRVGSRQLGGSLYEVAPGKKLWPYHVHHANEEWAIVVRGRPTLRTPEGEQERDLARVGGPRDERQPHRPIVVRALDDP